MLNFNGTIAGIGDKVQKINIIYPEFDATFRNFVVGKDVIMSGFNYDENSNMLSSGTCIASGYVGELNISIPLTKTNYVYGVFKINKRDRKTDSFNVEVYDSPLEILQQDDILNHSGVYYFQIYPQSDNKKYPKHAEISDYTTIVQANGQLLDNVKGVTQEVNDNSEKIATTEYVYKQIQNEVESVSFNNEITLQAANIGSSGTTDYIIKTTVNIHRELGNYIFKANIEYPTTISHGKIELNTVFITIPEKYRPINDIIFASYYEDHYDFKDNYGAVIFKLGKNGELSALDDINSRGQTNYVLKNLGYNSQEG